MARWTCGVQGFMAKPPLHWWDWCSLRYRQVASSLFYSGILLPMNTYCLLNSTHPLLHCLGYKSHGRCVAESDITRLFWCWGTTLFFSRLDNLDVNIPILFFLQVMVFHGSLPWQIVHIKIGRSQHGPKTPQVFTAVTSAEPGVRCLGRDANKCRWLPNHVPWWTPSWSLTVLGEFLMHPLQGPSLRKSFVSLPCYTKGNASVMHYPSAAPVHPWNRIALYWAKKSMCLRCKYSCISIYLYSDIWVHIHNK